MLLVLHKTRVLPSRSQIFAVTRSSGTNLSLSDAPQDSIHWTVERPWHHQGVQQVIAVHEQGVGDEKIRWNYKARLSVRPTTQFCLRA